MYNRTYQGHGVELDAEEVGSGQWVARATIVIDEGEKPKRIPIYGRPRATFDTYANDFRNNWQTTYGSQGGRYEDYEPYYRYGYDLASNPQYQGRTWTDLESNIQRDWSARYPNSAWDRIRNSVR